MFVKNLAGVQARACVHPLNTVPPSVSGARKHKEEQSQIDVPRELRFAHDGHEDKIRNDGLDLDPFKDEPT